MDRLPFPGLNRRQFLGGLAATGAAAALGLWPQDPVHALEPPPETTTLRIRKGSPACWAPMYMAEPLLREEGFTDIQYVFGNGTEVARMIRDGVIDLSPDFSALSMYNLEHEGHPLKFLSGLHVGCYALVGSERTHSVRDLKGRTVWAGTVENNGPHIFFSAIVSYVGLDPRTDVNYVWVDKKEAIRLFLKGEIDAFMSFPPASHELLQKGVGHLLVDTNVDKPWSQYFCCMVTGHSNFIERNPVATRRAIRAILKATDEVARAPEQGTRALVANQVIREADFDITLPEIRHIPYDRWRDYNPEDTIRFYALRMREIGMLRSSPQEFIEQHSDWRFLEDLKNDFGISAW